jgi:dihydroorotate dehydrogenase (fumarate)
MGFGTSIAGVLLEHPIMNAAGTCKRKDGDRGVQKLAQSAASAIVVGSITFEDRSGNEGNVYHTDADRACSFNSLGMPNRGRAFYQTHLPEMKRIAEGAGKPLIVSVAGFTPTEYAILTEVAFQGGADIVELNGGCPNVWDGGRQKQIISYDPELTAATLDAVERQVGPDARVTFKFSPADPFTIRNVAEAASQFRVLKAFVGPNTFPNAFAFLPGSRRAKPAITNRFAGFAGRAYKPIALGQVLQYRQALPERIQIIGAGGITPCSTRQRDDSSEETAPSRPAGIRLAGLTIFMRVDEMFVGLVTLTNRKKCVTFAPR